MATKSPSSQAFLLGKRLVDRHERTLSYSLSRVDFCWGPYQRLFTLQAAEVSQIHLSSPLVAAAWSCLAPTPHNYGEEYRWLYR